MFCPFVFQFLSTTRILPGARFTRMAGTKNNFPYFYVSLFFVPPAWGITRAACFFTRDYPETKNQTQKKKRTTFPADIFLHGKRTHKEQYTERSVITAITATITPISATS